MRVRPAARAQIKQAAAAGRASLSVHARGWQYTIDLVNHTQARAAANAQDAARRE